MSADDSRWWCFVTVGMYACTAENPHPSEHGCGPALNRNGSDVAPAPSPSTDTAGDADVLDRIRERLRTRTGDAQAGCYIDPGEGVANGLLREAANELGRLRAAQINRPAPDRTAAGVIRLLTEVDRYVKLGALNARSGVADAALDLADQVGYPMGSAEVDRILPECPTCGVAWPNRPAPDPDLRSAFREMPEWQAFKQAVASRGLLYTLPIEVARSLVAAVDGAGEPPTGSGCA